MDDVGGNLQRKVVWLRREIAPRGVLHAVLSRLKMLHTVRSVIIARGSTSEGFAFCLLGAWENE